MKKNKFRRGLLTFGTALVLLSSGLFIVNCASLQTKFREVNKYTTANKATLATTAVASVLDGITTDRNIKAGALESGVAAQAIIGEKPSTESIILFIGSTIAVKWIIGHFMSPKARNAWWGVTVVPPAMAAYSNNKWYEEHGK